jgi:hypothetical protein
VAVVSVAEINHFLTTLAVFTLVLLELSRRTKVIFLYLLEFVEYFAVILIRQTLLFVVGSL